jgi:hypothetical protein
MLELLFVDVDGDIGVEEMFKAAGVVKMEMPKDNSLYIFDVVACGFDCSRESVFVVVDYSREEIGHWDRGRRFVALGTTSFKEYQAEFWMFD